MIEKKEVQRREPPVKPCEHTTTALKEATERSGDIAEKALAIVDQLDEPLAELETLLTGLRRGTERATLRESHAGTRTDVGLLDNRYQRAQEAVRAMRRQATELARAAQRIQADQERIVKRVELRGAEAQQPSTESRES